MNSKICKTLKVTILSKRQNKSFIVIPRKSKSSKLYYQISYKNINGNSIKYRFNYDKLFGLSVN